MAFPFAKQHQQMTRASAARPASLRPALRPTAARPRPTARTVTAIRAQSSHVQPYAAPAAAPDSPRQQRGFSAKAHASAAPMASVTSPPLPQPIPLESFIHQSVMGRGLRFPHDFLDMAGAAVTSIPHALGAAGGRLAADATGMCNYITHNISNIMSRLFGRQDLVILPLDIVMPAVTEEATGLSFATATTELLELNGEGALSPQLPAAALGVPLSATAATALSLTATATDDIESVLSLELPSAAVDGPVSAPAAATPLSPTATATYDAEACASALRQLESHGRILTRLDQYVPHALAGMSQGRTFRLVLVRDRATLQRLAPAVCELVGMYGGVVVLGEEQGEQLMRSVLDMPADYTGHVESNKWEVLSCPSELQLHLKVPGRVHVVDGDKGADMRREANRHGYSMSKYGTWCAAADPTPSAPWWDVCHVDHHHEPLMRQRMGEWF